MIDSPLFEVLREDHRAQRELIDRILATTSDSPRRRPLFERLRAEALEHAAAEERVVYAELLTHEETRGRAGHSVAEHKDVERILDDLAEWEVNSPAWLNLFHTLADEVRHHIEEEEEELFALAERVLAEDELEDMADEFRAEKSAPTEATEDARQTF